MRFEFRHFKNDRFHLRRKYIHTPNNQHIVTTSENTSHTNSRTSTFAFIINQMRQIARTVTAVSYTHLVTRDMMKLSSDTGNVYETVAIIGKRANQIAVEMKQDLEKKLQEFASYNDNLEEVFENREQIEISRYYEKLPKPTLIAAKEYEDGKVYYKNRCV